MMDHLGLCLVIMHEDVIGLDNKKEYNSISKVRSTWNFYLEDTPTNLTFLQIKVRRTSHQDQDQDQDHDLVGLCYKNNISIQASIDGHFFLEKQNSSIKYDKYIVYIVVIASRLSCKP